MDYEVLSSSRLSGHLLGRLRRNEAQPISMPAKLTMPDGQSATEGPFLSSYDSQVGRDHMDLDHIDCGAGNL
jgi:hypothetical protein